MAIPLSREDFLDEIRIAPKWDIFQYYVDGFFMLLVFHEFDTFIYKSPRLSDMVESESKYFYRTLSEILDTPEIARAKVQ